MIRLQNIVKTYKGKGIETLALNNVSMEVGRKDFLAIMGRSGCGKTTILNIIGCMDTFNSGEYTFDGANVARFSSGELQSFRNRKIGFIFQAFNLITEMTVLENVEVPLGYAGIPSKKRKKIAIELLEKVEMSDKLKSFPLQLSGGQQQRIAIARALANNPDVILADEPTGNLDSYNGVLIMELLQDLNDSGKTIILVTHDDKVAGYAKRKVLLDDGMIINDIRI